jgi:hypothetical protein
VAVAECVGEDEAAAALVRLDAARRDHVGGPTGNGALATAIATAHRWEAERAAIEDLQRTRRGEMTRHASAMGAAEIARKKLRAARAFEARAEAQRLRSLVVAPADPAVPPTPAYAAAVASAVLTDGESMADTEVHPTVAAAELELREVEQAMADLNEGRTDGWRRLTGAAAEATESTVESTGPPPRWRGGRSGYPPWTGFRGCATSGACTGSAGSSGSATSTAAPCCGWPRSVPW